MSEKYRRTSTYFERIDISMHLRQNDYKICYDLYRDNNVSHLFKKGVKRRNFNVFNMNMKPYLVSYFGKVFVPEKYFHL